MKLSNAWSVCSETKFDAHLCLSQHASNQRHEGQEERSSFITLLSLPFASMAKAFSLDLIWQSKIARINLLLLVLLSSCIPPALSNSGIVSILLDVYLHKSNTDNSTADCFFPASWSGSWFQKFVPDYIHITRNNISEKGICRKNIGEKYIIENRYGFYLY